MSFTVTSQVNAKRVEHALEFIQKLDKRFPDPLQIGLIDLIDTVGREGISRYLIAYTILTQQRIIPAYTKDEIDDFAERARHKRYLDDIGDLWCRPVMDRFYAYLLDISVRYEKARRGKQKKRFVMHTLTTYVNAAKQFFLWLPDEVHDIRAVTQEMMDQFTREKPGLIGSLYRLVRYLNQHEKLFKKLESSQQQGMSPSFLLLGNGTYKRLLRKWSDPTEDDVRMCLIGLFMLLCCQSKKKVSEMKLEQIFFDDKKKIYSVRFGRTPVEMNDEVGIILARWLKERKSISRFDNLDDNPYLFPGRMPGEHFSTSGIDYYLRGERVTSQALFATAVYKSFVNGVGSPKTLIESYGIARETAMKYWYEFDPTVRNDVNRMRELEKLEYDAA